MTGKMRLSDRVALGGIVTALCLTIMLVTGVVPALYILAPMVAGMLLLLIVEEVSTGWAWLTYCAVSLLAAIVTYDKEAALIFILFFGYYPILRQSMDKIRSPLLRQIVKLLLFNAFLVIDYEATVYVLGLPTFEDTAPWLLGIFAAMANLVFLFYDSLLSRLGKVSRELFRKLRHPGK